MNKKNSNNLKTEKNAKGDSNVEFAEDMSFDSSKNANKNNNKTNNCK